MLSQPIFCLTIRSLSRNYGRVLRIFALVLLFLTLYVAQAQAYGFQNDQRLPAQQTPTPQNEPGNQTQLFLPIMAGGASPLDHDERPSQPHMNVVSAADHTGDSDTPPPEGNRHTFVTDSGEHLDTLWFRNDLPDGQLKFTIEITSPVVGRAHVDSQGFLTQEAIGDLVRRSIMPFEAILTHCMSLTWIMMQRWCAPKGIMSVSMRNRSPYQTKLRLRSFAAVMNSGMNGRCIFLSLTSNFPLQILSVELLPSAPTKSQSK